MSQATIDTLAKFAISSRVWGKSFIISLKYNLRYNQKFFFATCPTVNLLEKDRNGKLKVCLKQFVFSSHYPEGKNTVVLYLLIA